MCGGLCVWVRGPGSRWLHQGGAREEGGGVSSILNSVDRLFGFFGCFGCPELQIAGLLDIKFFYFFLWPNWPLSKIGGD